ncbi:hypothetical protein Tcan_13889 [Toxocara canis]|uniref:Uncharacterized protein n=1 Tax=Toxocara canis TaxID=6265 RepID=A0A0B2V1K9_TOXCA|nr:hypothetical protein Tcan_13889 [Toxocara canis]
MTEACSLTPLSLISLVNYIVISIAICHKIPSQESSRTCKTRNAPTFIIARNAKTYQEDNQNGSGMPTVLALARSLRKKALQYTKAAIYRLSGSSPPSITQRTVVLTTLPIDVGGITSANIKKF